MEKKKFKLGKFLVVISLTILIWVWADRAKTETLKVTTGVIKINESADPKLWITFNNKKSFNLEEIVLEGAASKIDEVQRKLRERRLSFEFFLGPEEQSGLRQDGEHSVNLLELLRKSQNIRQLGLSVKSCAPLTVGVQVQRLVENSLDIECIDKSGTVLKHERIEPSKVTIPVPKDWAHPAQVRLTDSEIKQARIQAIGDKIPFIELPDGQFKYSSTSVTVKLPPTEQRLLPLITIQQATLGIVVSPVLFGEYDIELKNRADLSIVNIRATSAAAQRYKNEPFQMYLYILDEDAKKGTHSKPVVYNFPDELVLNNEIELIGPPAIAEFELIPLGSNSPVGQ